MKIIELILDEEDIGVEAISVVENPAIEEHFIALKNEQYNFAEQDKEKRLLVGAALVPNKPIFRKKGDDEYYIFFSRETVRKASQMFFKKGYQSSITLEHEMKLEGLTVVESWLVESDKDKSRHYGLNVPIGTWMISLKVDSDKIWNDYIKGGGKLKGFSIEAFFSSKLDQRPKDKTIKDLSKIEEEEAQEMVNTITSILSNEKITLESYNDYPSGVQNNAKRGIELNEKIGNKCATQVGKVRAATLAKKGNITLSTIKRMYSFLSRAETYYDPNDTKACGTISYLLWGGKAALGWSRNKLRELGELKLEDKVVSENYAIIDDRLAYSTKEKALEMAQKLGCEGFHEHELEGKTWFMPCETHELSDFEAFRKYKCPKGYKKDYVKHKCVKMSDEELQELAKTGPRGGIRKSPKAPKSNTPNPNPKGKGTAKGDASTSRGAKVSKKDEATLKKKSDDFNERYKDKLGYGANVGTLKAVFQRGLGAFNVGHSPKVKSASQWSFARVNAFLYLLKNGRPQNPKYTGDFDLLPAKHPKSKKK